MKSRRIMILVLLAAFLIGCSGNPQPTASPAAQAVVETPLPVAETPASEPTPTPWAGDGHWYTFQMFDVGQSCFGLSRINQDSYLPLPDPYLIFTDHGVAIGHVKTDFDAKVYANDPEERFAWIPSTHLDRICGAFVREGVVLPEPDLTTDCIYLRDRGGFMVPLSDEAKEELLHLLQAERETAMTLIDPASYESAHFVIRFRDIEMLGYGYSQKNGCVVMGNAQGSRYLVRRRKDPQNNTNVYDILSELDPDSPLSRAFDQVREAFDAKDDRYVFDLCWGYYER